MAILESPSAPLREVIVRLLLSLSLVTMCLLGCGQISNSEDANRQVSKKEMSAADLFVAITLATDGKCSLQYVTHQCRVTMAPTRTPNVVVVLVSAQQVWPASDQSGSVGEMAGSAKFEWNVATNEVIRTE